MDRGGALHPRRGDTRIDAIIRAQSLAMEVIAERAEHRNRTMDTPQTPIIDHDSERMMTGRYGLFIYWSDDDGAFIAEVPELPGCMAHGDTREAALANVENAIQAWIASAEEFGDAVPRPRGRKLMYA